MKDDRLISLNAAIHVIKDALLSWSNMPEWRENKIVGALDKLPSAQQERKKGKWISHYDYCEKHGYIPSGLIAFWRCNQCEKGVEIQTNFCPNCGADMRGGQE